MKKSKYNYISELDNNFIIYNGLKNTCIILNDTEFEKFNDMNSEQEFFEQYCRLGFYIEENINELSVFLQNVQRAQISNSLLYYRIYTTTVCNARCYYCYEKNMKQMNMSLDTADKIYRFITRAFSGEKEIGIEWFGGEPLLNVRVIDYLSNKLAVFAQENNCKYWSRMVSNGLLFKDISLEKIKEWHLTHVQITLDGQKESYEKNKKFSTNNSFDVVISNIKKLLKWEVKVTIRLNYSEKNIQEILGVIDFLGDTFRGTKKVKVYGRRIMEKQIDNSVVSSEDTDIAIFEACLKNGFIYNILKTINQRNLGCVAVNRKANMILPNGDIGKCSQAIADGMLIGDVLNGIDTKEEKKWILTDLSEKCKECNLLPLCNGGCLYEHMAEKNFCMISSKILDYKLKKYLELFGSA